MTFEKALEMIEGILNSQTGKQLTNSEKEILKAAWDNETYSAIAEGLYLSVGHIKDLASLLWQRLSEILGYKINKNNFRTFCERQEIICSSTHFPLNPHPLIFDIEEIDQDENEPSKGNILIVDDFLDNLRFLTKILTEEGYRVRSVTNGNMAIKAAKKDPPDIILLDIKMPDLDGYEVCKILKSTPETKDIVVIFLSALQELIDKKRAFLVGGIDYITKPFLHEEVLLRVKTQLTVQKQKKRLKQELEHHQKTTEILYQSRTLLANLLNTSLDGIGAMEAVRDNITGEIIDFRSLVINPVMAKLLGQKRDNLMKQSFLKTHLNSLIPTLFDLLVKVVETGISLEQEFIKTDPIEKPYHLTVIKFGNGISLTIRELTEIKQLVRN